MSPAHSHRHDESQSHIETDAIEVPTPRSQRALDRVIPMAAKVIVAWAVGGTLGAGGLGAGVHALASGSETEKRLSALETVNAVRDERDKQMAQQLGEIYHYLFQNRTTYQPPRNTP